MVVSRKIMHDSFSRHFPPASKHFRLWTSTDFFGSRKQTVRLSSWFNSITSWNEHWIDSDLNRVRYFATGSFTDSPLVVKGNGFETWWLARPRLSSVRSYSSVKSDVHHMKPSPTKSQNLQKFWKKLQIHNFEIKISPRKNNIFHPDFFSWQDMNLYVRLRTFLS